MMLTSLLKKDYEITTTMGAANTGDRQGKEDSAEQKMDRYCEFEIKYYSKAQTLAQTANDHGKAKSDSESGTTVTFEKYFNALKKFSPLIKNYDLFVNGSDVSVDNGKFTKDLQDHFAEISKGVINIDDKEFLKQEVSTIKEAYINKGALVLAYALCGDNDTDARNFMNMYYKTYNVIEEGEYPYLFNGNKAYSAEDCSAELLILFTNADPAGEYHEGTNYVDDGSNSLYKRLMFSYLLGSNINIDEYTGNTSDVSVFEYVMSQDLYDYDGYSGGTYNISLDKIIPHFIWGHFIQDNFQKFGIEADNDTRNYLTKLASKISESPDIFEVARKVDNAYGDWTLQCSWYREMFNGITSEGYYADDTSMISSLNQEIKEEEESVAKAEAEANAQRIEQERKEKEENKRKAEEEAFADKSFVYGDDKKLPNRRYETEGEYFTNIEITDPVLWRNLKDKFRYFNPAYHSVSPEGFNARLTFLHQCTRQGQTCEMKTGSGNYASTASNLAFGRMPVCVLRIGDFINTRAIINSMSITYAAQNGMVWDLNAEGAGVQPMYANISLGITLLGGQSLDAPISRLQNAITFNYYANAESYDNRADVAIYGDEQADGSSTIQYKRIWSPLREELVFNEETGQMERTGRLVNNETSDFEQQHANDGTWKDKTDEEIADKFAPSESSGGTSGQTADDSELEYDEDATNFVMNYAQLKVYVASNFDSFVDLSVYSNKEKTNYDMTYDGQVKEGKKYGIVMSSVKRLADKALEEYKQL